MKRIYSLLLLFFVLFGCQEREAYDIKDLECAPGKIMLTSETPFSNEYADKYAYYNYYVIDVGREGGEFTVIASFPENEGVSLNDSFIIGWSDYVPDDMVRVSRTKINAYQSSYVITVRQNTMGKSYKCFITMFDESRVDKSGKPVESQATLVIRQQ